RPTRVAAPTHDALPSSPGASMMSVVVENDGSGLRRSGMPWRGYAAARPPRHSPAAGRHGHAGARRLPRYFLVPVLRTLLGLLARSEEHTSELQSREKLV